MPQTSLRTIRRLRSVAPFWVLLAGLFLVVVSGLWLHSADRFVGLTWGLTEMIHIWVGWACGAVLLAYTGHLMVSRKEQNKRTDSSGNSS